MFEWLKGMLGRGGAGVVSEDSSEASNFFVRRYEAAKTDRLNAAQWAGATGESINAALQMDLETLRYRAEFEADRNAFLAGVIDTYTTDMVGNSGPVLQVHSSNARFNEMAETLWRDWWAMPDLAGSFSGNDFLDVWVRLMWTNGEFLAQKVTDRTVKKGVQLRLNGIAPRRLATPPSSAGNASVVLGVERDANGKPLRYWIEKGVDDVDPSKLAGQFEAIPEQYILHEFVPLEPGQLRGVPWCAAVLQSIADLRDFDAQTLDAARAAADFAVLLTSDHPDSKYLNASTSTSVPIKRRQVTTMPPGWAVNQLKPEQPTTTYKEYRKERLRDLGRPVGMPSLYVMLDAGGHNFSSARFDANNYWRGIERQRSRRFEPVLRNLALDLIREGAMGELLPQVPPDVRLEFVWPARPYVDPDKEEKGIAQGMKNGTENLITAAAAKGRDWEILLEQEAKIQKKKKDLGLSSAVPSDEEEADDADDTDDDNEEKVKELVEAALEEKE